MGLGVGDEIISEISDLNRQFAIKVVSNLARDTPIDTGNADGNWFVDFSARTRRDITFEGTRQAAINFVASKASQETIFKDMTRPFFIHNNAFYIVDLNEGSSKQADPGYIDVTLINTVNQIYK